MFKPPILQPLTPGQIGGLSTKVNTSDSNLAVSLNALREDLALQNVATYGAGRFVNTSAEIGTVDTPPTLGPRIGTGLAIELPVGAFYLVNGYLVDIADLDDWENDEDGGFVTLEDAPAAATSWGYLSLDYNEDSGYSLAVEWLSAAEVANRREGFPCIGKVTTSASAILSIDPTAEDVIWSMSLVMSKVASLSLGGGGGGEGGGGPTSAEQLPIRGDDATDTATYVDNGDNRLDARINKLASAAETFPQPFDILADEIAINRAGIAEVNPHAIERGQISVIVSTAGLGQDDTPNYSPATGSPLELPYDAVEGVFQT